MAGSSPDGTPAATAELDGPSDVLVDVAGDRFVLDSASSTIEEIPASSGTAYGISMTAGDVYEIAGTGVAGDSGDSGQGHLAKLDHPGAIALDGAGDLFIADTGNDTVRVLAASSGCLLGQQVSNGDIYTVIGTPREAGYYGDGGPASAAKLDAPAGVAVDDQGDVFVADSGNDAVREVAGSSTCPSVPDIETLVGTGSAGSFTSGSLAAGSALDDPTSLAVGPDGDLYLDDQGANLVAVDALAAGRILGQSVSVGHLYAVAGDGTAGAVGNGGAAAAAELDDPGGITLDRAGDLYLTDPAEGDVRVVTASATASLFGVPTATGDIYQLASGLVDPLGLAVDVTGAVGVAEGSAEELALLGIPPSITSASSTTMQAGAAGSFQASASGEPAATFTESGALPSGISLSAGGLLSGTPALGSAGTYPITLRASNGVGAVAVQGFTLTVSPAATTLGLALAPSNPLVAQAATLTVTVSPAPNGGTTVDVSDTQGWFDCPIAAVSGITGNATCTSTELTSTVADHVSVHFAGDSQYGASSTSLAFTPAQAPTSVQLSSLPGAPTALSTTKLIATVSPIPDGGDVAFSDTAGYVSGCASVSVNTVAGTASCTTATLATPGPDTFSATYLGDASYATSAAARLAVTIGKAATTVAISTAPSPLLDDTPGAFIATSTGPDGPVDGGTVGFSDTAGNISSGSCSAQPVVPSTGRSICTLPTVAAANDTVTAAYSGDALYAPVTVNAVISPTTRATAVTVSVSTTALVVGQSSVLSASVNQQGATGTVSFSDPAGLVAGCTDVPVQVTGSATCPALAPATPGSDQVTASYSGDENDAPSSATVTLPIDTEAVLASPTSYTATAGDAFGVTLTTAGTPPVSTITLDGGALPPGASLTDHGNGTATVSGAIPTDGGGAYTAEIALDDGVLAPSVVQLTITVDEAPSFSTTSSGTCVAGAACDISVSATGFPAPSLSLSGNLPAGLSFVDQGGGSALISGTPGAGDAGSSSFAIDASNGIGQAAVLHFTLAIAPAPSSGGGSGGGGGSSGGGASSPSPAAPPASTASSANTSSSPSSGRSGAIVVSSYSVSARLSGTVDQALTCPASLGEVHDDASATGSITELGFDLSCSDGPLRASLSGSITARREVTHERVGSKLRSVTKIVWEGGFRLSEPKRHLVLTLIVSSASVNHDLVISATSSAVAVAGHATRAYRLTVRIVPQFSTS